MSQKSFCPYFPINDVVFNVPASNMFGFKTGGKAYAYAEPKSYKDLRDLVAYCKDFNLAYKIIGNGTNLLLSDNGYNGVLISLKQLNAIKQYDNEIKVLSGANLSDLILFCLNNSFSGLQNLVGIPATVGGAVAMNASAFGVSVSDNLTLVEALYENKLIKLDKDQCEFSYRNSIFLRKEIIILSAKFSFPKADKLQLKNKACEISSLRRLIHPVGRSCGSVFKNPSDGIFSGFLIEQAGLKGEKVGGASVSNLHSNFIIAEKNCTSKDVFELIKLIKEKVYKKYSVNLIEEIEYIGDF